MAQKSRVSLSGDHCASWKGFATIGNNIDENEDERMILFLERQSRQDLKEEERNERPRASRCNNSFQQDTILPTQWPAQHDKSAPIRNVNVISKQGAKFQDKNGCTSGTTKQHRVVYSSAKDHGNNPQDHPPTNRQDRHQHRRSKRDSVQTLKDAQIIPEQTQEQRRARRLLLCGFVVAVVMVVLMGFVLGTGGQEEEEQDISMNATVTMAPTF